MLDFIFKEEEEREEWGGGREEQEMKKKSLWRVLSKEIKLPDFHFTEIAWTTV